MTERNYGLELAAAQAVGLAALLRAYGNESTGHTDVVCWFAKLMDNDAQGYLRNTAFAESDYDAVRFHELAESLDDSPYDHADILLEEFALILEKFAGKYMFKPS